MVVVVGLVVAGIWIVNDRPKIIVTPTFSPPAVAPSATAALRVTFLGVATLVFDDGETAFMTDGFFTRPSPIKLLSGKIAPDRALIAEALRQAGVTKLAAVLVNHSHYDHAMDAPEVARLTGAVLVGSESTANIGRGWDLPEAQIKAVKSGDRLTFGRFTLTFFQTSHNPPTPLPGTIDTPLRPPVLATAYREGGSYTILIDHDGRRMLVNASAGFVPGVLEGQRAAVVFLGTGALDRQSADYKEEYWRTVVTQLGARRVIPIHWDDFSRPLAAGLSAPPRLLDNVQRSFDVLATFGARDHVDIMIPTAGLAFDPFAGLPPG